MVICDVCNIEYALIGVDKRKYYLLVSPEGGKYGSYFDNLYEATFSDHKSAMYDIMLCKECFDIFYYYIKSSEHGDYRLPEAIPIEQNKRYMLEILRRVNDKNRLKR
jgi:hypothetical protein